jgi:release factor glutamine methyltransferase
VSAADAVRPDGSLAVELVADATARLAAAGVATPDVDARLIARAMLGTDGRRDAEARPDASSRDAFERAVVRRCAREPLQLIVGGTGFHAVDLVCRPGVFVPRPETEVLVELALAALAARRATAEPSRVLRVAEPCTGSGAVALAIAAARADVHVVASDRSEAAVALARDNLAALAGTGVVLGQVEVREGDLLAALDAAWRGTLDVLVANPPYLPTGDRDLLAPEVVAHDPHDALFGGPDGHELVDALLVDARTWLAPGGHVLIEIDDRRANDALAAAQAAGLEGATVHPDLTGRARVVVARRPLES